MKHLWKTAVLVVLAGGCAGGLGGSDPANYTMTGVDAGSASPAEIAEQVTRANSDFALVVAPAQPAWFGELATATGLTLSGPATGDGPGLALLSRLELLGDTSIVIGADSARFYMQDALYQAADERYLDLMVVNLPAGVDVDAAVRELLRYMATDVMATASVVLGVNAPTTAVAVQVDSMLRAAFMNAVECGSLDPDRTFRVFFGPPARTRCTAARRIEGAGEVIAAGVRVGLQY